MFKQRFRKLTVWKKAMSFVKKVYCLTKYFPKEEKYGLSSQLKKAAVSIVLNIAEGSGADSDAEFNRFLSIANRSNYEVICAIELAKELAYVTEKETKGLLMDSDELSAMMVGLKKKLIADG